MNDTDFDGEYAQIEALEANGQLREAVALCGKVRLHHPESEKLLVKLILLKRAMNQIGEMVELCLELSKTYGRQGERTKQASLLASLDNMDQAQLSTGLLQELRIQRAELLRFFGYHAACLQKLDELVVHALPPEQHAQVVDFLLTWLRITPSVAESGHIRKILAQLGETVVPRTPIRAASIKTEKGLLGWFSGLRARGSAASTEQRERRALPRPRCFIPVSMADAQGFVVDISSLGLRLQAVDSYEVGDTVKITCPSPRPTAVVSVQIVWVRKREGGDFLYGCKFAVAAHELRETWVGSILDHLKFPVENQLNATRSSVRFATELAGGVLIGEKTHLVTVLDLSFGGALIDAPLSFTQNVILDIFNPPGLDAKIRLVGRPVSSRPGEVDGHTLNHVKWVYLTPEESKRLQSVLKQIQLENATV